jgi:hypothetical protein
VWFPLPGAYLSCDWLVNTSYPISSARNSLASENRWQLSDVANFLNIEDEKIPRLLHISSLSKNFVFYIMAKLWNLATNFR